MSLRATPATGQMARHPSRGGFEVFGTSANSCHVNQDARKDLTRFCVPTMSFMVDKDNPVRVSLGKVCIWLLLRSRTAKWQKGEAEASEWGCICNGHL